MRRASIALGGLLVLALYSQALADQLNPRPDLSGSAVPACAQSGGSTAQGGGGGAGRRNGTGDRKAGGEQIGSATSGAGAGRVQACASGPHKAHACANGQH